MLIVVSNPLDAMCHVAQRVSGWPRERVIGMAGILDTSRFATFIAWETGSSVKDVTALVLGGHGDQMVPVVSAATVGGVPLRRLVAGRADRRARRAHRQGRRRDRRPARDVGLVRARARRPRRWSTRSCSTRSACSRAPPTSQGEYGIDDLYMGVPVRLGAGGMEAIVELELDDAEREALAASAAAVREVVGVLTDVARAPT